MNKPTPPAATAPDEDDGIVLLKLNTRNLPAALRADLEANAHLQRTTPAGLLARLISRKLAHAGVTLEPA